MSHRGIGGRRLHAGVEVNLDAIPRPYVTHGIEFESAWLGIGIRALGDPVISLDVSTHGRGAYLLDWLLPDRREGPDWKGWCSSR